MMQYCSRCVYPQMSVNTMVDDDGVCSACGVEEEFQALTDDFWKDRRERFGDLVNQYRSGGNDYDCIVAVSGGKDSYFQTHVVREFGLKPLLITYHGNNYLPEGQGNLDRMRDQFDADQLVFGPSVDVLKKLNRIGFELMGDMNWHGHAGIKIVPMQMAVRFGIPLVFWGETTWSVAGMFSPDDFVEYNKRTVTEHDLRGYQADDMIGREGLTRQDLKWLEFPSDEDVMRVGVRGIYIGNYFKWDANAHTELVRNRYAFECARQPFERTYRMMSNLDDMHENGLHDYMKFIKFGYGRASDHSSKDIRSGYMTRDEGIEMVRRYDHVKPRRDLERWLEYVGMSENAFDVIADRFRDRRVWWIEDGQWFKQNVWGEPSSYGPVKIEDASFIDGYKKVA